MMLAAVILLGLVLFFLLILLSNYNMNHTQMTNLMITLINHLESSNGKLSGIEHRLHNIQDEVECISRQAIQISYKEEDAKVITELGYINDSLIEIAFNSKDQIRLLNDIAEKLP
jgi:predicted PurR-regulated permease PerM